MRWPEQIPRPPKIETQCDGPRRVRASTWDQMDHCFAHSLAGRRSS